MQKATEVENTIKLLSKVWSEKLKEKINNFRLELNFCEDLDVLHDIFSRMKVELADKDLSELVFDFFLACYFYQATPEIMEEIGFVLNPPWVQYSYNTAIKILNMADRVLLEPFISSYAKHNGFTEEGLISARKGGREWRKILTVYYHKYSSGIGFDVNGEFRGVELTPQDIQNVMFLVNNSETAEEMVVNIFTYTRLMPHRYNLVSLAERLEPRNLVMLKEMILSKNILELQKNFDKFFVLMDILALRNVFKQEDKPFLDKLKRSFNNYKLNKLIENIIKGLN